MPTKKIFQSLVLAISIVILFASANGVLAERNAEASDTPTQDQPAIAVEDSEIVLYPAGLDIAIGKTICLTAKTGGTQSVEWTSSDPNVATVEPNGTVHVHSAGETMITAASADSSDACRLTATAGGATLAYPHDPGPQNEDGEHEPVNPEGESYPVIIPDNQESIDENLFDGNVEYSWQLLIDDGFDVELNIPNAGFSYMVNYHIYLDARRVGGSTVTGDYHGTMDMEMAIDEESFISAMKSMDVPVTNMNFAAQVKTIDVNFSIVPYQSDEINAAKDAFLPSGAIPIQALTMPQAMAISTADTSTSGSIDIKAEKGSGGGAFSGDSSIPYVIEVRRDGQAVLYLPKMLSMCNRNSFKGVLARLQILDLP